MNTKFVVSLLKIKLIFVTIYVGVFAFWNRILNLKYGIYQLKTNLEKYFVLFKIIVVLLYDSLHSSRSNRCTVFGCSVIFFWLLDLACRFFFRWKSCIHESFFAVMFCFFHVYIISMTSESMIGSSWIRKFRKFAVYDQKSDFINVDVY